MVTGYIPTEPEELTPEWLTQVLRGEGCVRRAAVVSVGYEVIGAGRGFTGRVVRLQLGYDVAEDGAPRSLVAKFPATDPGVRAELNRLGVYAREFGFYTEIAGAPGLPVPRPFYVRFDPADCTGLLLLEDLDRARPGDNVGGCSDEDAYLAVSRLARLQSAWWHHPGLAEAAWLVPLDPDGFQVTLQTLVRSLLEKFGGDLPERLQVLARALADSGAWYMRRRAAPPWTLVHGDFRLDNLLFGPPEGDAALTIIDWQVSFIGQGVTDVAYFAAFCLHTEQRRAIERRMIEIYHSTLLANGVQGYTLDRCLEDYRFGTLAALSRLITAGAILDVSSERGRALTLALIDRIDTILADHHAGDLLPG